MNLCEPIGSADFIRGVFLFCMRCGQRLRCYSIVNVSDSI